MSFWLFYMKTFHEPAVLLRRERLRFFAVSWPLKTTVFQSFVEQNEAVSFPEKGL